MTSRFAGRGQAALLVLAFLAAGAARADVFHFSGTLDPAANSHLTFWDQLANAYAAPVTGPTDADMAQNIAVYTFSQPIPGPVSFDSKGFVLGGFDSVLSVFEGTGDSAAYVHHESASSIPGDPSFILNLGSGEFTVAVTMFLNEPCAAGFCFANGTFADGFTNLVNFDPGRPAPLFFDVQVTTAVPEPGSLGLLLAAILGVLARNRFRALLEHP